MPSHLFPLSIIAEVINEYFTAHTSATSSNAASAVAGSTVGYAPPAPPPSSVSTYAFGAAPVPTTSFFPPSASTSASTSAAGGAGASMSGYSAAPLVPAEMTAGPHVWKRLCGRGASLLLSAAFAASITLISAKRTANVLSS